MTQVIINHIEVQTKHDNMAPAFKTPHKVRPYHFIKFIGMDNDNSAQEVQEGINPLLLAGVDTTVTYDKDPMEDEDNHKNQRIQLQNKI